MLFDLGYGLTALSYALFLLLLLTVKKAGLAKHFLVLATLVTLIWSLCHISYLDPSLGQEKILVYDAVRQLGWVIFLSACLRSSLQSFTAFFVNQHTLIALILPSIAIVLNITHILPNTSQFIIHTLIALQMLVMTELVYRQAGSSRWAFKPLVIFIAVMGTVDFVTYTNAIMLNTLSWDFFAARGYIFFAILPFLFIAVRRITHWGIEIFVSREVVLHSTLLMIAGVYLLLMGIIGYAVQYYGGDWSTGIQIAFSFIALVFLAALLLSQQVRSNVKVFITKHFYANQFDYRVEWVKLTKQLATLPNGIEDVYQKALEGWLASLGYSVGVLYKKKDTQMRIVAQSSDAQTYISDPMLDAFAAFLEKKCWIIDVDELAGKPEIYEALSMKSQIINECRYQLIIPMTTNDKIWGIMAMSSEPHNKRALNWELRDYISAVSEQITSYILNAESREALAENAKFDAFNKMSAFVVHDLKNVLAQVNLILSNAQQHKNNPEFIDDTFETLGHTKVRMDKMLKQLMQKNPESTTHVSKVNLTDIIERVIDEKCKSSAPIPILENKATIYAFIDAEKMSNILFHLINNAQQATSENGLVKIQAIEHDENILISIQDNGIGMTESFIQNRLFKPFETTKGNAGMGIGAYDAKVFIEEIGGALSVSSAPNQGTTFHITLPTGTWDV